MYSTDQIVYYLKQGKIRVTVVTFSDLSQRMQSRKGKRKSQVQESS